MNPYGDRKSRTPTQPNKQPLQNLQQIHDNSPKTSYQPHSKNTTKMTTTKQYKTQKPITPYNAHIQTENNEESQASTSTPSERQKQLLMKIGCLMRENVRVNERVSMYEQIFPKIVEQNQEYQSKIEKFIECWEEIAQKLERKGNYAEILEVKVKSLEEECAQTERTVGQLHRQLQLYKQQNKNLHNTIITLQSKLTQLQTQITKQTKQITTQQQQLQQHKQKLSKLTIKSKQQTEQLQNQIHQKQLKLRDKERQIEEYTYREQKLKEEHQGVIKEGQNMRKQLEGQMEKLRVEIRRLENEKFGSVGRDDTMKERNYNRQDDRNIIKIKKKNQQLIKINKMLEEQITCANQRILVLQRVQQEKACSQYVGRLSRLKKSTYAPSIYEDEYPLKTLENIQIHGPHQYSRFQTYKHPLYDSNMPPLSGLQRTRINSHKQTKTII